MESGRTSGVGTPPFEPWPDAAQVHVEWGPTGARLAGDRGDVVVIVDVLAFSTRVSLSPASLATIGPGDRLIFTSLNGAACTSAASNAPIVLIGALTNRTAVADSLRAVLADGSAGRVTVVACGERWTSVSNEPDSLRPGIEDLIGAGAIASALGDLRRSAEADVAAASFEGSEDRVLEVLRTCVSGRELVDRGFPHDVELAAAIDSTDAVPCWDTSNEIRAFTARGRRR